MPVSHLNERKVRAILLLYRVDNWTASELAELFGVSLEAISKVITGRTWVSVTGGKNVSRHRRDTTYRIEYIRGRLDQGCNNQGIIARELGITRQAVGQLIKNHIAGGN